MHYNVCKDVMGYSRTTCRYHSLHYRLLSAHGVHLSKEHVGSLGALPLGL